MCIRDRVIMMFDAAQEISDEDREIIRIIEDKRVIVLINKDVYKRQRVKRTGE